MKLLALRHNATGLYFPHAELVKHAQQAGIPHVLAWDLDTSNSEKTDSPDLLKSLTKLREAVGVEGFVMRFASGRMYKVKTNWYFTKHRSLSFLKFAGERHVWEAILRETLDDVKPFLPDEIRVAIERFSTDLLAKIRESAERILETVRNSRVCSMERKQFVEQIANKAVGMERAVLLKVFEEEEILAKSGNSVQLTSVVQRVVDAVISCLGSKKAMGKMKSLTGDLSYETYRPKNFQMDLGDRYRLGADAGEDN